jgi:hypothetical protein
MNRLDLTPAWGCGMWGHFLKSPFDSAPSELASDVETVSATVNHMLSSSSHSVREFPGVWKIASYSQVCYGILLPFLEDFCFSSFLFDPAT